MSIQLGYYLKCDGPGCNKIQEKPVFKDPLEEEQHIINTAKLMFCPDQPNALSTAFVIKVGKKHKWTRTINTAGEPIDLCYWCASDLINAD